MTRCHVDESCSKVLNFLERVDDRIGCAHEETVAVTKPRGVFRFVLKDVRVQRGK